MLTGFDHTDSDGGPCCSPSCDGGPAQEKEGLRDFLWPDEGGAPQSASKSSPGAPADSGISAFSGGMSERRLEGGLSQGKGSPTWQQLVAWHRVMTQQMAEGPPIWEGPASSRSLGAPLAVSDSAVFSSPTSSLAGDEPTSQGPPDPQQRALGFDAALAAKKGTSPLIRRETLLGFGEGPLTHEISINPLVSNAPNACTLVSPGTWPSPTGALRGRLPPGHPMGEAPCGGGPSELGPFLLQQGDLLPSNSLDSSSEFAGGVELRRVRTVGGAPPQQPAVSSKKKWRQAVRSASGSSGLLQPPDDRRPRARARETPSTRQGASAASEATSPGEDS
ncbi:hypothetical protein cyc_08206 [Cyclospora cayetanensis]|uniref:Uncharacterized protein n=1 Tax=Cyclospora cayetanensis TaxID=88456 RepID=A0A1D3D481_9EIME|nr:hypothetical protein cyc_08206 [Cyclospora cayetanensis]